jgi:hypothetical protein
VHDEWELKKGQKPEQIYYPQFPSWAKSASGSGHGGGDFFTNYYFADAIRKSKQPYLDVYRGVAMSVVGIMAWKSVLDYGNGYKLPDFRNEKSRKQWEKDNWSPLDIDNPDAPPASSGGKNRILMPKWYARAKKIWKKGGHAVEG